VVSGRSEAEVKRFAQRLGADAFLSKPIDRNTLVNTVARLFVTTNAAFRGDADDRSP
jgi:FixJ family two-component response regulator